jgi:hypothetical protein
MDIYGRIRGFALNFLLYIKLIRKIIDIYNRI